MRRAKHAGLRTNVTISLPADLWGYVRAAAEQEGRTYSDMVECALIQTIRHIDPQVADMAAMARNERKRT